MRRVIELGGSAISDRERVATSLEILRDCAALGDKVVVVVSALPGVTDELIGMAERAGTGDLSHIEQSIERIKNVHVRIVEDYEDIPKRDSTRGVELLCEDLNKILVGIAYLRELTARSRDYVLSFGERLSTTVIYHFIKLQGLEAKYLLGGDCGVITDDKFGDARPLYNVSKVEIGRTLKPLLDEGIIPVITGFTGKTQDGFVTTLGRGGSDYTTTLIGAALRADEVWILGEVEGLMTADPNIVSNAKVIPTLSYLEAMEMAHFRAKAIHPRALEPVAEAGIPVRIMSIFKPRGPGTLISREVRGGSLAKAVTVIDDAAMITLSGGGMMGAPGTAAKIFKVLGDRAINILMISQSSSEVNISLVVPEESLDRAIATLEMTILGKDNVREVDPDPNISVISLVGAGMRGTPGIAAKVFDSVAEQGINVRMIAQGSSEANISFAVDRVDGVKAVKVLHSKFNLDQIG